MNDLLPLADIALRGLLVMGLLYVGLRFLPRDAAALRHALWSVATLMLLVLPLGLLGGPARYFLFVAESSSGTAHEEASRPSLPALGAPADTATAGGVTDGAQVLSADSDPISVASPASSRDLNQAAIAADSATSEERNLGSASLLDPAAGLETRGSAASSGSPDLLARFWPLLVWAAGALLVGFRWGAAGRRLAKLIRASSRADRELMDLVRRVATRAGLGRPPRVHLTTELDSPAVTGCLRSRLLLPVDLACDFDRRLLEPLLLHEMVHLVRRDPLMQALGRTAALIHWFNPFVWAALREIERDRELLTDARVVALEASRSNYAEGLLRVIQRADRPLAMPASALGLFDGMSLRDRMARIVRGETVGRAHRGLCTALVVVCLAMGVGVTEVGLAGLAPAVAGGVRIQDEEKIEATVRVSILPPSKRTTDHDFMVKEKVLTTSDLVALLRRYSVVDDPRYRDARGLSSTRLIIDLGGEIADEAVQKVLVACANLKIYRIEIENGPVAEKQPTGLVLDLVEKGRLRFDGVGYFDLGDDAATLQAVVKERLDESGRVTLRSPPGTDHKEVMQVMDLLHRAGARSITVEQSDGSASGSDIEALAARWLREVEEARGGIVEDASESIDAALTFLSRSQGENGAIGESGLADRGAHDVGRTGLALLAFLGAGETADAGAHRTTVARARDFLLAAQKSDGCFGDEKNSAKIYGHAIAGLALAELHGLTGDEKLKAPIEKAVAWTEAAQNPYQAWRYGIRDGDNDSSVTSWMLMFLKSAAQSGIEVDPRAMEWGAEYLSSMTDPRTGRTGYVKRGGNIAPLHEDGKQAPAPRRVDTTTAMASFARLLCGTDPKDEVLTRGRALMLRSPPLWLPAEGRVDLVYWYFGTQSMHQAGGESWNQWERLVKASLLLGGGQVTEGDLAGSWEPAGLWGREGGRVYSTALAALSLEICQNYARAIIPARR